MSNLEVTYKIILVGNAGVGKTSFLHRFIDDDVPDVYPTIGVDFRKAYQPIGEAGQRQQRVKLHIWDASGQTRLRSIVNSYYRDAIGILMFFDLSYSDTLTDCESWIKNIMKCKEDATTFKIVLVGNKSDMDIERQIDSVQIAEFIENMNATYKMDIRYAEASANNGVGVSQAMELLVQVIHAQWGPWPIGSGRSKKYNAKFDTIVYPSGIRIDRAPLKQSSCVIL
jgi:small GTP-binding protein